MADARPEKPYTFDLVAGRLSQAGMTLLALHVAGCRPAGYKSFWPDIAGTIADERTESVPTPREISDMDEALGWIGLIPASDLALRKLVGARSLCRPHFKTGKPVPIFSWKTLGARMGCSEFTSKSCWMDAIGLIVVRLNQPGLCETASFRGSRQVSEVTIRHAGARLARALREVETA